MIAASSTLSVVKRQRPGLGRPLDRLAFHPGSHVCGREREQVPRRVGVARLDELGQLSHRLLVAAKGQEHAPEVEPRQTERRLPLDRQSILRRRRLELPLTLEQLSEIVARLHMRSIHRERPAIGVCRRIPLLLLAEQHTVIVVRLAEIAAKSHGRPVVFFGLGEIARTAVQAHQVRVRLHPGWILCEGGLVSGDRPWHIAALRQPHAPLQCGRGVVAERRHAVAYRIVDGRPTRAEPGVLGQRPAGIIGPS